MHVHALPAGGLHQPCAAVHLGPLCWWPDHGGDRQQGRQHVPGELTSPGRRMLPHGCLFLLRRAHGRARFHSGVQRACACVSLRLIWPPSNAQAAILDVPFVDVVSTMSDPSLPLTVIEYGVRSTPGLLSTVICGSTACWPCTCLCSYIGLLLSHGSRMYHPCCRVAAPGMGQPHGEQDDV